MSAIECLECGGTVSVDENVMVGEVLECMECGAELEIVALDPLAVELAPEVEEDWGE
ncbi:MAG: lysine biosynthesis protein LysW [Candidatus Promineifilaceae bacterium]|jgi:alpha-aminoadipate carrier protein LysW